MILRVRFEVFGQVADAVREKGDLHFGRAGVTVMGALVRNQFGFLLLGAWQDTVSLASYRQIGTRSLLSRDTITALTPKINPARRTPSGRRAAGGGPLVRLGRCYCRDA